MTQEISETCTKYVIQRIINPGVYWMARNQNSVLYEEEMQQFDHLLSKNVVKISNSEKISIEQIIAVKNETGFHRGLVTDIFNRNSRITYLILLIDYGNMIETNEKKIYLIKNKELIHKKAHVIQVSIKGIQPVVLDLEYDKHFLNGIFCKRVQHSWSVSAYKYVQDLFGKNPCVFVKPLNISNRNISGEIYFIQESDKAPVSLGQKLCDNGFAVFCDVRPRSSIKVDSQGDKGVGIEEKIPEGALSKELQHGEVLNTSQLDKGNLTDFSLTDFKASTVRVVQRTMELHGKQKKQLRGCQN